MSYCRDPIYVSGIVGKDVILCCENKDLPHSLHEECVCLEMDGRNYDEVAFRHMAEHYRVFVNDPQTIALADAIYYAAFHRYLQSIPIFRWFFSRLRWRFEEKYGFVEEVVE